MRTRDESTLLYGTGIEVTVFLGKTKNHKSLTKKYRKQAYIFNEYIYVLSFFGYIKLKPTQFFNVSIYSGSNLKTASAAVIPKQLFFSYGNTK